MTATNLFQMIFIRFFNLFALRELILTQSTKNIFFRKEEIMKTFKQIAAQIERIERLYYNFGCGTKKMLETAERFFSSQPRVGLQF